MYIKLCFLMCLSSNLLSNLRLISGETLILEGQFPCEVKYEDQKLNLNMIVASYVDRPTLLGRDWLRSLTLDWNKIFSITTDSCDAQSSIKFLLNSYATLFEDSYEGIKGHKTHINISDNTRPVYFKPRPVPYALKQEVEKEVGKLETNGVLVKTDQSDLAAPAVIVPKSDKTVRICGDYKVTVNQAVVDEKYPLPTSQDLFAALTGGKVFSKLDLSHAYAQVNVDRESQKYLTINTHKITIRY